MDIYREYTIEEKKFFYINFSNLRKNDDYYNRIEILKKAISKHPPKSLYSITNIENIRIDTRAKTIIAEYMKYNSIYVKYGAIFGLDGTKRLFVKSLLDISGRENIYFTFSEESAVEWLLTKD